MIASPGDYDAIKALVARTARGLGAGDVRVVSAFPDEATRERMRASFERGDLATWGYTGRYARAAADPAQLLEHAKAVICVAVPYAGGEVRAPGDARQKHHLHHPGHLRHY